MKGSNSANTFNLDGTYLPRHPHDRMSLTKDHLRAIEPIGHNLFTAVTERYPDPNTRWEKMDRFWAGQEAKYMIYGLPFMQFMPGKEYTYSALADVVEHHAKEAHINLEGAKILEDGCGSAIWSLLLAKKGGVSYLFDKSWCGLEFAKFLSDADHFGVNLADVRQGDFYHLPDEWKQEGGIFDILVSGAVLEHLSVEDQNRYLSEAFRVLKPGGLVAFTMPNPLSPENIESDERRKKVYEDIEKLGDYKFTLDLPMAYDKKGGLRNMGDMLRTNGYVPLSVGDAVLVAPSAPLERRLTEDNPAATEFYERIERMCTGGVINRNIPILKEMSAVEGLIDFWQSQTDSLTPEKRSKIGRWLYAVGQKPYKTG